MSYTKTVWNDDKAPFIEASNLNKMEDGIKTACDGVDALNVEMDAVDANLGNKNLKTYTDLSQIGCSVNNTITEVMTALPQSSELIVGTWSSASNLNTSLGIGGASGILTCRKFNADRGDVVWRRTQAPATIYTWGWHNGSLTSAEQLALNSDLATKNLRTYTDITQIGLQSADTIEEIISAMPNASECVLSVASGSALANSLPLNGGVGELRITKTTAYNGGRGRVECKGYQSNVVYVNFFYNGSLANWEKNVLNSDLPQYKDLSLTFGTNNYASIQSVVPSGFAPVSVMSLKEWTNLYLVHRNGNDWSVFGADAGSTISVRIWFAKV